MVIMLVAACVLMLGGLLIFVVQPFTVTFDTRGGEKLASMKTTRLGGDKLPIPVQPGQTFLGWTESPQSLPNGKNTFTSTKQINSSTKLYAHWENTNYVINFYSEGELVNQLGFNRLTSFVSDMMSFAPYRNFFMPVPYGDTEWKDANFREDPESGQKHFVGWSFKDAKGRPTYLWHKSSGEVEIHITDLSNGVGLNVWTLEYFNEEINAYQRLPLSAGIFRPQLYDTTMHAVWLYRGVDVEAMSELGETRTKWTDAFYGETLEVGADGSLNRNWYSGSGALIGWKIGFADDGENRSPLKIDTIGDGKDIIVINNRSDSTGASSRLSPAQLQRINDLFDKVHPISEPFYVDPLLAYLTYQKKDRLTGEVTHALRIYPVIAKITEGVSDNRFFDARFNPITESGLSIKRVQVSTNFSNKGTAISLGKPRARSMQKFKEYYYEIYKTDANGNVLYNTDEIPKPIRDGYNRVTLEDIEAANKANLHGVRVTTNNMHPIHSTVFYEAWEQEDITITFDYGPDAVKNKRTGVYSTGKRLIHDLTYGASTDAEIKSRYINAVSKTKEVAHAGETIVLPSASMYTVQNMSFLGWQEGVQKDGKLGRIYPAGYEYTVLPDYGFAYTLSAVWADATINFSFNLDGGHGFNPKDLSNLMRGRVVSDNPTKVKIPADKPTRFGYDFIGWESNKEDELGTENEQGKKISYQPGDEIRIKEKQILTAKWKAKSVSVILHYEFEDGEDEKIEGQIHLSGAFDQTIRLKGIPGDDAANFDKLYRHVGWTFRDPGNKEDTRALTFGSSQIINLNERIVREVDGTMCSDAFLEDEKNTVGLTVYADIGDMSTSLTATTPLINSYPRLVKEDYQFHVDRLGLNLTHDFMGFFVLPKEIVEMATFRKEYYWDDAEGTFTTGTFQNTPGQFLSFYPATDEQGKQIISAGLAGQGKAENYRITEEMYFFLWLKPKPVYIDFYGTDSEVIATSQSYIGDRRAEVTNLGDKNNLIYVPPQSDFFFLDWTVEYYYINEKGEEVRSDAHTHTIDLRLNAKGEAEALKETLFIDTNAIKLLDGTRVAVSRIAVKPNMQSVHQFVVRIVDDGSITGTRGLAFSVELDKIDKITIQSGDKTYIGGTVNLDSNIILNSTIRWHDEVWGKSRWPHDIYGNDLNYWQGQIYVGPGSEDNPRASLGDLLDYRSKTIKHFWSKANDLGPGTAWDVFGAKFEFNKGYSLHALPTTDGLLDVRTGSILLYPVYDEISYAIHLMNGFSSSPMQTIVQASGGVPISVNGGLVTLGSTETINKDYVSQNGYCFDLGINALNLSTVNNLDPNNNKSGSLFSIGKQYRVGYLESQIPPRSSVLDAQGRRIIQLYIVWQPNAVALSYENTGTPSSKDVYVVTTDAIGDKLEVGKRVNMLGRMPNWSRPGYVHAGWSLNKSGSDAFAFADGSNGMQQVLLSASLATSATAEVDKIPGIINVTKELPDTSTFPYTSTVRLYPYWKPSSTVSVKFDFSPIPEDNASLILEDESLFKSMPSVWTPVNGQPYVYKATGTYDFGKSLVKVESDWRMFNYKIGNTNDAKVFGGWYYIDQYGIAQDLEIINENQIALNEVFLLQNIINPDIVIKAKWVSEAQPLIRFNIASEAVRMQYEITAIPNAKNCAINSQGECTLGCTEDCRIVYVTVRNGISGDIGFDEYDNADNVPYKLKYNEYIGPRDIYGNIRYTNITTHPQFYRTEVAVKTTDVDGKEQIAIRALNPMYERLTGEAPWNDSYIGRADTTRTVVSKANPLVRYETRLISDTPSKSPMNSQNPFASRMAQRIAPYNTSNTSLRNYAMFDGREGDPKVTGTGVQINNIYRTFVLGETNSIYIGDGENSRYTRTGYQLVGFAISDQFNSGVAFGWDSTTSPGNGVIICGNSSHTHTAACNAPNVYENKYLFSPKPEAIVMVPIYEPLDTRLTLRPGFENIELLKYTDLVYPRCTNPDPSHICLETCGESTVISQNNSATVLGTKYDQILDLPYLNTRGKGKNPLLDRPEWQVSWEYTKNLTERIHAVYGSRPEQLSGYELDDALGFQVEHDPRASANGNLDFEAVWGSSQRMEIRFNVLEPAKGIPMNQWTTKQLAFNRTAINEIGGPNAYNDYENSFLEGNRYMPGAVMGSVAEHYKKPILENGVYNYARATYNIPTTSSRLPDSAFNVPFATNAGLRLLGWFMENPNTPGKPHFAYDAETNQWGMPKNPTTGKYEYQYMNGAVDKYWQQDSQTQAWELLDLSPQRGGLTQVVNVYLVYDWTEGTVSFNSVFAPDFENYPHGQTVTAKYGDIVTLPTSDHLKRNGKELAGWTMDYALQSMRSYVDTLADAMLLDRTQWKNNDFVKIANGPGGAGIPALYRKIGAVGEQGTLAEVTVYKGTYAFDQGSVEFFAIWEDKLVTHYFMDDNGATTIWGLYGSNEMDNHNPSYGLETTSTKLQNGLSHQTKFFQGNTYGGTLGSLPRPTKEGYKFLYWRNSLGQVYQDGMACPILSGLNPTLTLYAVWAPYYYQVEFDLNNSSAGSTAGTWANVDADIRAANGIPSGRVTTQYNVGSFTIPTYSRSHFVWSANMPDLGLLGWTLKRNDGTFLIDTRNNAQTLKFSSKDSQDSNNHMGKVGFLNRVSVDNTWVATNQNSSFDYTGTAEEVSPGIWVRKVTLYALWNTGSIEVKYYDIGEEAFHAQDAYMLNAARNNVESTQQLVVPSRDSDYAQYGVMVADESIFAGTTRIADMFNAGQSFAGWEVRRTVGEDNLVGRTYYPGDYLDGIIRDNIELKAKWHSWQTNWDAIARDNGLTYQDEILVIPGGVNFNSTNQLVVTNPKIKTIIFPRMTAGVIGENSIIAHGVTRIVLPSTTALTVAPQAIRAKSLTQLYIGDNIVLTGNPVGGEVHVNQSTGAIEIESALKHYLVRQGAYRLIFNANGTVTRKNAVVDEIYSDVMGEENYLRGGNLNRRADTYFFYGENKNFFGALYNKTCSVLYAYPSAASSVTVDSNVRIYSAYAFSYMSKSVGELAVTVTNTANTTVQARAVFHTNASTIRLPSMAAANGVDINAISGYQPNLANLYFGTANTSAVTAANVGYIENGILYRTNGRTQVMYVTRSAGTNVNIGSSTQVTSINDYALSSFYGVSNTALTINTNVALTVGLFQDSEEIARGQHTFYLTRLTLSGAPSIDHRVFSRMGGQFTGLHLNSANIALNNLEADTKSFPIFVPNALLADYISSSNWASTWGTLNVMDGLNTNRRMQTESKTVTFNAGSVVLPDVGLQHGTGTQTSVPAVPMYGGQTLIIPDCTFNGPMGTAFGGWRVTSQNSAIDGKIYHPGWAFSVGMTNSQVALNKATPSFVGEIHGIYIQSSITLTAIWEVRKIQFIDNMGATMSNQKVLVSTGLGTYRNATNLELAGKMDFGGSQVNAVDQFGVGLIEFILVGSDQTFVDSGENYAFVGWIKRAGSGHNAAWRWGENANISERFIPDGSTAGVGIRINVPGCQGASCVNCTHEAAAVFYHALYDITSTNAGTVTYTASGQTNASARITNRSWSGDIGIPAAVVDTNVVGAANVQGFMKRVTTIEQNGFANLTSTQNRKVYIGGSVQQIQDGAFMQSGSSSITEVRFGHNYNTALQPHEQPTLSIGIYAFYGIHNVTNYKLPLVTTSVGAYAFSDNLRLTSVTFETTRGGGESNARLQAIGNYAFWGNFSMTNVFAIPATVSGNGQQTIGARAFAGTNIANFTSVTSALDVSASSRYFTIDGNLCFWTDANNVTLLVYAPGKTDTTFTVGSGIHLISSSAFVGNMHLSTLTIPATVKSIAVGAFEYSFLQTIILNHTVPSAIHNGQTPTSAMNPFLNVVDPATFRVRVPNASNLSAWNSAYSPVICTL